MCGRGRISHTHAFGTTQSHNRSIDGAVATSIWMSTGLTAVAAAGGVSWPGFTQFTTHIHTQAAVSLFNPSTHVAQSSQSWVAAGC